MSKYEIMLILDPTSDEKIVSDISSSTFKSKDVKIEKLERTELAYEINKSKTSKYLIINVTATGEEINEFTRKSNITKSIWRILSINLDTEKGLQRKSKPRVFKKPMFNNRKQQSGDKEKQNQENITDGKKESKVSNNLKRKASTSATAENN